MIIEIFETIVWASVALTAILLANKRIREHVRHCRNYVAFRDMHRTRLEL